jgi:hypothetical protein
MKGRTNIESDPGGWINYFRLMRQFIRIESECRCSQSLLNRQRCGLDFPHFSIVRFQRIILRRSGVCSIGLGSNTL